MQLGDGTSNNGSVARFITDNATLVFANPNSQTQSYVVAGVGNLTVDGPGTLTLSGANTFNGVTRIVSGGLTLSNPLALQNSTFDLEPTDIGTLSFGTQTAITLGALAGSRNVSLTNASSQPVALTVGNNNRSTTYSGVLSDSGSLTTIGTGTLIAHRRNTYSGGTTISGGTLQIGDGTTDGLVTGDITDNATLGFAIAGGQTPGYGGAISGTGILIKAGTGMLTLTGTNNTYTGGTLIQDGTLQLGANDALPIVGSLGLNTVGGATLDLNGYNQTIGNLCGSDGGGGTITLGSGTLTVDAGWYTGAISGSGGILDVEGFFVLDGAGSYTGGTTVGTSGYLEFDNSNVMPNGGAVTIATGGVVDLYGTQQQFGTISGSGTVTNSGDGDQPAPAAKMMALSNFAWWMYQPGSMSSGMAAVVGKAKQDRTNIANNPEARPSVRGQKIVPSGDLYQIHLSDNGMSDVEWVIDWGDGSTPQMVLPQTDGNPTWFVHQYAGGSDSYAITVTAYSMMGTFIACSADGWTSQSGAMDKQTTNFEGTDSLDQCAAVTANGGKILAVGTTAMDSLPWPATWTNRDNSATAAPICILGLPDKSPPPLATAAHGHRRGCGQQGWLYRCGGHRCGRQWPQRGGPGTLQRRGRQPGRQFRRGRFGHDRPWNRLDDHDRRDRRERWQHCGGRHLQRAIRPVALRRIRQSGYEFWRHFRRARADQFRRHQRDAIRHDH